MEQKLIYATTKEALLAVELPVETATYKPVSHKQLIDLTLEGLHKAGLQVENELYSMANEGNIANGKFRIQNVGDSEMKMQVAWQNSYDKSKVLTFSVGAWVLVCENGLMSYRAVSALRRKHTGEIQTFAPQKITEYLMRAGAMFEELQKDRDAMKQIEISERIRAELIGRMFMEQSFLESTQLNILKRVVKKPRFDYGAPGSLWELYQNTTYAIGGIHPSRWLEDHIDAHRFFSEVAGIIPPEAVDSQLQFEFVE